MAGMFWSWRKGIFDSLVEGMNLKRFDSVVDLGCAEAYLKEAIKPRKYVGVGILNDNTLNRKTEKRFKLDVVFDIDTNGKWPFKKGEFDLVVASQILEHLSHLDEAAGEIRRIAKNSVLIGLPNDMRIDKRILALFGKNPIGIIKHGHCRLFDIPLSRNWVHSRFIEEGFALERIMYFYTSTGQRFIPGALKRFLAGIYPNLFAGEVYFLLRKEAR